MAAAVQRPVPETPRVISPSPDPSDPGSPQNGYFPPVTRSATKQVPSGRTPPPIPENDGSQSSGSDGDTRARSRSRSRDNQARRRRMSGLKPKDNALQMSAAAKTRKTASDVKPQVNGHLSPASAAQYYWRELSRSPSPLGLIPIHREWRSFIHRHEIPRKALHISIGFLTLSLYAAGSQTASIHPVLLTCLVPIAFTDLLRHNWPPFNRFYIRCLGAFMREYEAHDKYNGVIWYLLGAWAVLRFCPKDVATVSVVLLSWCDTAASTFGRLYGRYTPRIRRGKSLAGSLAAFAVGVGAAAFFWGWLGPRVEAAGIADNTGINAFAFQQHLSLPASVRHVLGLEKDQATISGALAVGVMSVYAGLAVSFGEAVDLFGLDDNVTIPIICGLGLWGFLKVFGSA